MQSPTRQSDEGARRLFDSPPPAPSSRPSNLAVAVLLAGVAVVLYAGIILRLS